MLSLCCITPACDTLDVATVSSRRNAAVVSLSPVHTMTEARIDRLGIIGLSEALGQFPGVNVKDYGGIGGLKTVSVRNMGASHTSVLYDGIAVSDARNGQVDLSRFSLDDISSVSMSIGLADDIFTSARHIASAGILRIDSDFPSITRGCTEVNARMTYASFSTYNPHVSVNQRVGDKCALRAALNATFSEGDYPFIIRNGRLMTEENRINGDVEAYGAEMDFHAGHVADGRLRAKVNAHYSERGLPGSIVLYTQNAYERLWDLSVLSNLMYDRNFGEKWKFHADAGVTCGSNRHLDTDPAYGSPQDSRYVQNEYSAAVRGAYLPADGWQIVLAEDVFVNTLDSNIPECPFPLRVTSATALSAEYSGKRFRVAACLAGMYVKEDLEKGGSPADRSRLSPVIGVSWNILENLMLRASFKEGFRVPTFNDLYYSRVGNVNLRPEVARQCNVGLTYTAAASWGAFDMTTDMYCNSIKDKITAVPTMFIWKMRNVGKVAMYGADVTASVLWKTARWLTMRLNGNYSLQYALDVTDSGSKNYRHQIPYTPRHCGSVNLLLETPWVNFSYRMHAVGPRYSGSQNMASNEMAGYADHSVSVNRDFAFGRNGDYRFCISVEGLNLSGDNYEVIHYYPMPGRSFRLTLKFKY